MAAQCHDLTDDWSLPSAYFVDSLCPFRCSFGFVSIEPDVLKTYVVLFDNAALIYLINLLWKLELRFRLESELHYFSICHGE